MRTESFKIKLFVDDIRRCPDGWTPARTITEAIEILSTQEVAEVSLDYYIGHEVYKDGKTLWFDCKETFEPVAWFIRRAIWDTDEDQAEEYGNPRRPKYRIKKENLTIHSSDPRGAKKMCDILKLKYEKVYKPSL